MLETCVAGVPDCAAEVYRCRCGRPPCAEHGHSDADNQACGESPAWAECCLGGPVAGLELRKLSYCVWPWRIGVVFADGRFVEIAHASFPRKRDGLPVLAQLQALQAPWHQPWTEWPADVLAQARAIIQATPGYARYLEALARTWPTR